MALPPSVRKCPDCEKIISFDEFLENHPHYSIKKALFIWNDTLLTIFCPKCFFNAPEKPYRKSRYRSANSYPRF